MVQMVQKNCFGQRIPPLVDFLDSDHFTEIFSGQLCQILVLRAGVNREKAADIAQDIFSIIRRRKTQQDAASAATALLAEQNLLQSLRGDLPDRARRMAEQVKPFLAGDSVLDFGCGNGEVGLALHEDGHNVTLCDILDRRSRQAHALPLMIIDSQSPGRLLANPPDTLLILNVFHHADDPLSALGNAAVQQAQRIIVIESVFDVETMDIDSAHWKILLEENPSVAFWLNLSGEQQLFYNAFWDWFFTQVVNGQPQTPFNYQRTDEWRAHFAGEGYHEMHRQWLGIDQPLVPEFHVLLVFDRDGEAEQ
jgi:SAM-dependent methyltransferase